MEIHPVERPSKAIIEGFRSISTSTVSDILDRMGLDCLVSGIRAVSEGFRLVGPAVTIKEVSGLAGTYTIEDFKMGKVIDTAQQGDVLVFDNAGKEISTWGGMASTAAKVKGIEGVVIDGGSRDADEVVELDFPVFSRHITPRGARTRIRMLEMNGTVQCGGIRVRPGDIVMADRTGILVIPGEKAGEILDIARKTEEGEKFFTEELRKGKTFEEMHRKTGQI
jgi:3-hexulose-6-phosphate synthase / 6-phospho-3-hexuloisomerase